MSPISTAIASPPAARQDRTAAPQSRMTAEARAATLSDRVAGKPADAVLRDAIAATAPGRIAMVTSFGADSAVLLHIAASVDPALPVIFLDTGKLFGETLRYRDALVARLGLTDVRSIEPDAADLKAEDPDGILWAGRPDRCCYVRKVLPLQRALDGIDTWITGRKRFQGGERSRLAVVESLDGRVKVNPLAHWSQDDIAAYFDRHDLPQHPLKADGYLSIGCMPCTDRASDPGDARSGRWAGQAKTECGIHLAMPAPAR
ncbi:phosphoadenylyl-sulfate reductase [Marinibaculum pumilum]|uniref:Adenosine 5'-phosphosulfate reductase n=1 Tax=Marinibaculum pumilum TaxID=1766165 RepID=A0ABV7KVN2_9PROT